MREIEVRAGEAKRVFSRAVSSIPETIEFDALPMKEGETVSGTVEIRGSSWIIPKKPISHPLQENNSFEKGPMDSNYALYVIPDIDVRILVKGSSSMKTFWIIMVIAMLVVLVGGLIIILLQN